MEENENQQTLQTQQTVGQKKKSKLPVLVAILLVVGLILIMFWAGYFLGNFNAKHNSQGNNGNTILTQSVIEKAEGIQKVIDQYYLEEEDVEKVQEGVYKGMLEALGDPYSVYYTKEEYEEFQQSYEGEYCGIGAVLTQNADTGIITIVRPFEDSPAAKAGMETDDILYKVEGEEVTGQDLSSVVAKVKGVEGTKVNLVVMRDGKEIEMNVERKTISIPTVESKMLEDNIGYIQIAEFDEVTVAQWEKAYETLTDQGMNSLIVDLRDNPGGGLDVVAKILDTICPEGVVVYHENKYGQREEYTSDEEHKIEIPMVVLVNGNSASASEIFAGAVKDYGIGTLIGTTTYGKGIVQQMIGLKDGSAMKVTISKYYTPSGVCIHKKGIEPDITLEFDSEAYKKDKTDNQLNRAIEELKSR